MKGKIFRSAKRHFDCQLEDRQIVQAVAHATVLKSNPPVVGDDVELKYDEIANQYEIIQVHDRNNEVYRMLVREKKKKTIAANIDYLAIVSAASNPIYKSRLIDRYLVRAEQWNITPIVILNKMDEFDHQFNLDFEKAKFKHAGAQTFCISAKARDQYQDEYQELERLITGKTVMLIGQSGVGKSKLITALSDGKFELLSAELAKGIKKGAHTTTWSEIIDCDKFLLIDSPGVRSMAVDDISPEDLRDYFVDLHPYFFSCKFNNCEHLEDSKGCSFNELDPEILEHAIVLERLESYLRMKSEIEEIPNWQRK